MAALFATKAEAATTPCLVSTAYANVIPLLSSGTPAVTWTWTSTSTTPIEATDCAAVYGNLWGVGPGSTQSRAIGGVTMTFSPALSTNINLSSITGAANILGYPELIYGYKPSNSYQTMQSIGLQFPMTLSKIPNLWLVTNYSSQITDAALPMDFSYDLWITKAYLPSQIQKGDIELMIWLYHQNLAPSGTLLPGQPFTTPIWINGSLQNATFDIYAADPTLPNRTSELVTFVLRGTSTPTPGGGGIPAGYVGVNLQPLLVRLERALNIQFGWSTATMNAQYLNGLELGEEFEADGPNAQLGWVLNRYCIVKPKTGAAPTQANASSYACP